jgi:hypothetical protein
LLDYITMKHPDFLLIGERRSGTTTLANWIMCHPDIYLQPQMDIGYFIDTELVGARKQKSGKADYKIWNKEHSKQGYSQYFKNALTGNLVGEKSADYLFWTPCHSRIKKMLPNIKLIITLRDPIKRAYSMYWNELGKKRETRSFEEAVKEEHLRMENSDYAKMHLSYIERGFYDKSIIELLKVFDSQNVFVIILEDAIKNPINNLKSLYEFLEIDTNKGYNNAEKRYNSNWTLIRKPKWDNNKVLKVTENMYYQFVKYMCKYIYYKNVDSRRHLIRKLTKRFRYSIADKPIDMKVKLDLIQLYKPSVKRLEKILDRDLAIWLKES